MMGTCTTAFRAGSLVPGTEMSIMSPVDVATLPGLGYSFLVTGHFRVRDNDDICAGHGATWFAPQNFQDLQQLDVFSFAGLSSLLDIMNWPSQLQDAFVLM